MDTSQTPQLEHQEIVAFKIWYSDSEVEGHSYDDWVNAPDDDVQVVMLYFEQRDAQGRPTRLYSSGCDNYGLTKDMQFSSSLDDPSKVAGHTKSGKYMNWKQLAKLEKTTYEDWGQEWLWTSETQTRNQQEMRPGKMKAGQ